MKFNWDNIVFQMLGKLVDCTMRIGLIKKKNIILSRYAISYIDSIKKHTAIV